jgi:adenine/guanine phosphoribosyltransferase-like PRPP-binding protein
MRVIESGMNQYQHVGMRCAGPCGLIGVPHLGCSKNSNNGWTQDAKRIESDNGTTENLAALNGIAQNVPILVTNEGVFPFNENEKVIHELKFKEDLLRTKLFQEGKVTNVETGYLRVPWVNEIIDTRLQHYAAQILAFKLRQLQQLDRIVINKVAGIPTQGVPLSVPLAEELGYLYLASSRKGKIIPTIWQEATLMEKGMKLYKNGAIASHIYNGIHQDDIVVLADDILGDGDTIVPIIQHFIEMGVRPYVAVYVAKLYRPGYQKLRELGIYPVYVYGIKSVGENNKFELTPNDFS